VIDSSPTLLNVDLRATFSSEGIYFNYSAHLDLLSACTELLELLTVGNSMLMYCRALLNILCCNENNSSANRNLSINFFLIFRHGIF
jgi:hypothetical protein